MNKIGHLLRLLILYGPLLVLPLAPLAYLGIKSIIRKSTPPVVQRKWAHV